jgi:hypothetical protein
LTEWFGQLEIIECNKKVDIVKPMCATTALI